MVKSFFYNSLGSMSVLKSALLAFILVIKLRPGHFMKYFTFVYSSETSLSFIVFAEIVVFSSKDFFVVLFWLFVKNVIYDRKLFQKLFFFLIFWCNVVFLYVYIFLSVCLYLAVLWTVLLS